MFGFWDRQIRNFFPGHALHEKGLQRQRQFGPLVSSKEQKRLSSCGFNNSSPAGQPRILLLHSVYRGFRLFAPLEARSGNIFSMLWGVPGTLVSWANCSVGVQSCRNLSSRPVSVLRFLGETVLSSALCAASPSPAPPSRCAPLRTVPLVVRLGLGLDRLNSTGPNLS